MYWKKNEGRKEIEFGDTAFAVTHTKVYDCQFGDQYYKKKPVKGKRLWLQASRKVGCGAHIEVKSFALYPEYAISDAEKEAQGTSKWKLRCLYEEKMKQLKTDLANNKSVQVELKHFVSLPCEEAHSGHPTGHAAGYSQKLNPHLSLKISEMVSSGITDTAEVKRTLKMYYVDNFLVKELGMKPHPYDRAFYPLNDDIRNHVHKAKRALDLSKLDQDNMQLKIAEWKVQNPTASYHFRPYSLTSTRKHTTQPSVDDNLSESQPAEEEYEETLLYVHQEDWQKELLTQYGNTLTLIDATYKTTKYTVPLFFICVKTNVSYSVVAEFIIQSESTEQISEALAVIKRWNPTWNPNYFMMDYSDAEMSAIQNIFPSTQIFVCDFHREQAWERWVKDKKHGLSDIQGSILLELLRDCTNALPNRGICDKPGDYYYKQAEKLLQDSDVWKGNEQVKQWLSTTWLSCPTVRCSDCLQ